MLDLNNKSSNDKVCAVEMDDGGRCVLINDPQLLQSLFGNTTPTSVNATAKKDARVAAATKQKMETTTTKKEVKARKSTVVATKSSPANSNLATVDLNGKQASMPTVNTFPIGLQQGQLQQQQQPLTLVPNSMGLMSLTGSLPVNAQSVSICPQQTITLNTSSAMNVASNSSTIRAPTPTLLPQAQFQIGPRPMTVHLPQQLLMPGMQMGQPGLSQFVLTSRNPNPSPSLQSGPVLQLIQTSQGTQLIKTNPTTSIQQMASIATTTTTSSGNSTSKSRSNKQILPKPQNSSVSTASTLTKSTPLQSNSNNNVKFIQQQPNTPTFNTTTLNATSGLGGTHQFVLGPQGQTFLLNNNMLPNIGSQPFFIQGNGLQNGPVQLAIRPQAPLFVNSNTIAGDGSNLSISLANNAQLANNKPMMQANQQQTFVISNANASANAAPGNLINLRPGAPNIIFRPQFQQQPPQQQFLQIQTANGPMLVALPPQQQLAQPSTIIQQPAAPANAPPQTIQVGNTLYQLAPNTSLNLQSSVQSLPTILTQPQQDISSIPSQGASISRIIQSNISNITKTKNTIGHNIFNTNNNNNQPSAILSQGQSNTPAATNQQSPKTSSSKGLNLADLLKETGILTDFSPPTSPKNSQPSTDAAELSLPQAPPAAAAAAAAVVAVDAPPPMLPTAVSQSAVLMVQGGALNAPQNVLIATSNNNSNTTNNSINTQPLTTSQLRVTIGPDGTLMVVPPGANAANAAPSGQFALATLAGKGPLKDSSGIGSSQPSPDSTTPSIDTSTSSPSTPALQSVSSLISLPTSTVEQMPVQTLSRSLDAPCTETGSNPPSAAIVLDTAFNQLLVARTEAPSTVKGVGRSTICDSNKAATAVNFSDTSLQLVNASNAPTLTSQKAKSTSEPIRLAPSSIAVPLTLGPMLGMVTLADVTGVPILQVNSSNVEFMSRLDSQIKAISSQTSFNQAQLDLLKELKNIQDTILKPTNSLGLAMQLNLSNNAQHLLQLSTIKNNSMQILFAQNQSQNGIQIPANVSNLIVPQSVTTNELVKTTAVNSAVSLKSLTNSQGTSIVAGQSLAKTNILPQLQVRAEPEKLRPNVPKAIHQQLNADQNAALHPDCKTSFKSQDDAFKRLLRYHVFDWPSPSVKDIELFDESFEKLSQLFMRQKSQLYDKFRYIILRESMNKVPKSAQVFLDRLFVEEETNALKADREKVSYGKSLKLPPLPESWVRQQREKEKEKEKEKELSLKRKLSTEFDDDFEDRQTENVEIADICNMLEEEQNILNNGNDDLNNNKTNDHVLNNLLSNEMQLDSQRNRDIECVDQLIDQFNSQDEAAIASGHLMDSDHQSFLDSLDNVPLEHGLMSNDDLEAFYSGIDENGGQLDGSPSPWSSSNLNSSTTNSTLQHGSLLGGTEESTSRMSWNGGFNMAEAEAEVAVQSIMSSNEETNLSVDLSGMDDLDTAMDVDKLVNFDDVVSAGNGMVDETNFLGADTLSQQPQSDFDDMQMDCAIKSIMGDVGPPTMSSQYGSQSQSFNQFLDNSMSNSTSYHNNLPYHMSSHQMMPSNMRASSMMPYQSAVVNDTMLDEAVKSILS